MQTALVHTRSPRRLVRQVGIVDAVAFLLLIAGTPLTFLLAPVMWAGTAAWYGFGEPHVPLLDSGTFWTVALINLIVGNGIMIGLNLIAAVRGQGWRSAPFALLNPAYWILHSIAAWRALVQLIRNPFYWEKTSRATTAGGIRRLFCRGHADGARALVLSTPSAIGCLGQTASASVHSPPMQSFMPYVAASALLAAIDLRSSFSASSPGVFSSLAAAVAMFVAYTISRAKALSSCSIARVSAGGRASA